LPQLPGWSLYPTPKPKDLVADAVLDCTSRGDIVLDPFLGSGSSLIAAEKVGRRCFGMDLDPGYVDLAVRRWQSWTGRQAVHAETGERFDDLLAAAELQLGTGEQSNG
jgi:DNA modification methylase